MIMGVLVVDVWFYYSKSLNCCIEIRALLDDGSGLVCPPTVRISANRLRDFSYLRESSACLFVSPRIFCVPFRIYLHARLGSSSCL